MGIEPSIDGKLAQQQKQKQQNALKQAFKIVVQLKLFENQAQLKQQRHLFARILVHGHHDLITHLKKFNKDQQKDIFRYLRYIDYETTDLLYQNLVLKKIKQEKKKVDYAQYTNFKDKSKELCENQQKFRLVESEGEELLSDKKVAIVLFAGGMSSRFKNKQNQTILKQFYVSKPDQKCLLQITLDKISSKLKKYPQIPVYLILSQIHNSNQLKQILSKYPELNIKKVIENQIPIINLSGKMCIKSQHTFQILMSPRGCGDLANLSFKGVKILQQMKKCGVQYVFTMGIQNIFAQVADRYLLGTLATQPNANVAFSCTYPDNQSQNLKRVVFNKSKSCLEANQLQNLLQTANKNCSSLIRRSPVWINNSVFRLRHMQQYFEKKRANYSMSSLFSQKIIQCTYWNPGTNSYNQLKHCYVFERELNNILLNEDSYCIGVMVERQKQFLPVITLDGEWNWEDAYSQYMYQQSNQSKKIRNQNYYSKAFYENSQM